MHHDVILSQDAQKIHAEVNQILNQRYLLTTLALTLFGVFAAWGLPGNANGVETSAQSDLAILSAIFLFIVLALIFFESHYLRIHGRLLTLYLEISGLSKWEKDWVKFRKGGHFAYTKTQSIFFAILGALVFSYPMLLTWYIQPRHNHSPLHIKSPILVVSFILYEAFVFYFGFISVAACDRRLRARWEKILHQ